MKLSIVAVSILLAARATIVATAQSGSDPLVARGRYLVAFGS